mmetsp:Transcript_29914/g.69901  ORF Transcript_29914/g.69901 Transcript_29914/m.69901 type:complete len:472 (-) Transcript_29914:62-1477(-)
MPPVIACHPSLPFVAIASAEDTVLLYDLERQGWSLPRLAHASQHLVSCAEWEPVEPTSLAVGCAGGVCLWVLFYSSEEADGGSKEADGGSMGPWVVMRAHLVRFLAHTAGAPVSAISWSPYGGQLASVSRQHPAVSVWDAPSGECEKLWFRSGGGCASVSWAPGAGAYLCAVGVDGPVRVWEAMSWKWETLHYASFKADAFASAAWSADGSALLLLPAQGAYIRYVLLRNNPPTIAAIDGGSHTLPLHEGDASSPAFLIRPGDEVARSLLEDGWPVAAAALERALAMGVPGTSFTFKNGLLSVEQLPGHPSGFVGVLRFADERTRTRAAAELAGSEGENGAWVLVEGTSDCHMRHAVWDGRAERLAICVQEEIVVQGQSTRVRGKHFVQIFQTRLDPVLQLTVLGGFSELPASVASVRVPGRNEARREQQPENATGPQVVGFARTHGPRSDQELLLAMAWETGEIAFAPCV